MCVHYLVHSKSNAHPRYSDMYTIHRPVRPIIAIVIDVTTYLYSGYGENDIIITSVQKYHGINELHIKLRFVKRNHNNINIIYS